METTKSKNTLQILEIAKINLRHNAILSIIVSAAVIIITPVIFGTANLDKMASSQPMEMFISLIGIVLFTPVFQPEQNEDINALVSSKYVSTIKVYLIRTAYAVILSIVLVVLFGIYMGLRACDVTLLLVIGTIADIVFLGSLGMVTAALTNNTVISYMIPMVYYALNYGMGAKLGNYYLFSMSLNDFEPKIWLLITGILFIVISLVVVKVKPRFWS